MTSTLTWWPSNTNLTRIPWICRVCSKMKLLTSRLSKVIVLQPANACIYTRGHFRSYEKDDSHTIRSAIAEAPMLHVNFMVLCFTEPELLPIEVLLCGNRNFLPCKTLTLTWWPSYTSFTRILSTCTRWANMNFLRQGFRNLCLTHTHAYYIPTYIQTDRHDRNYIPCRFAAGQL